MAKLCNGSDGFSIAPPTIGPVPMVFGPATIAPDGFSMVINGNWSKDGMVTIYRYGLVREYLWASSYLYI